jgi:predicted O-methyltransferase YrrM
LIASRAFGLKDGSILQLILVFGPSAIVVFSFKERPWRFAFAYGVLLIAVSVVASAGNDSQVYAGRNFFGIKHVAENEQKTIRYLRHGTTLHGAQYIDATMHGEPLSYYHRKGPVGEVFKALYETKEKLNVAVIGLGVGTIASYIGEGSKITFFEIDSAVKDIAEDQRYFNFLTTVSGELEIIVGDGRVQLSKAADGTYDVIILDAFSSDSIPVHLLTSEAIALYKSKIKESGILVFHISNRFIDLKPVLAKHANTFRMTAVSKYDQKPLEESETDRLPSDYGVMGASDSEAIGRLQKNGGWKELAVDPTVASWTDKYSNIINVLKPIDLSIGSLGKHQN